jgi:hypothetical protein
VPVGFRRRRESPNNDPGRTRGGSTLFHTWIVLEPDGWRCGALAIDAEAVRSD